MVHGDNQPFRVTISSATIVKAVLVLLAFWFLYFMRDLVVVLLTSLVIASGIEPIVLWMRRYKVPRTLAVLLIYLLLALLIAGIFYFFVPLLFAELSNFISELPSYLETISVWNPFKDFAVPSADAVSALQLPSQFSFGDLLSQLNEFFSNTSRSFLEAVSSLFGGILSLMLMIVLSFYLAVQEDGIARFLKIVLPARQESYVIDLWRRSQTKIGRWLQGQLLLGIFIGVLVYLGLTILGVKNALLLAFIAAIFEIIPIFGPILSAIPATIFALIDGGVTKGLLVIGLYTIINQFENHLIYPLVVRKVVGIPPIIVILAIIIGFKLAGVLGIILSVPISAILVEFLDDLQKDKQKFSASAAK